MANSKEEVRDHISRCREVIKVNGKGYSCQSTNVRNVFVTIRGKRMLYAVAYDFEELNDAVDAASEKGLEVEIVDDVVHVETFEDQAIADESEKRISEIVGSWAKYPKKASEASATKLIAAYFNSASLVLEMGIVLKVNKFASANWDDVASLRDTLETQEMSPATKILRDRVRDLCELFGSPRNLESYESALAEYERAMSGKDTVVKYEVNGIEMSYKLSCPNLRKDDAYTASCSWGIGKLQQLDESVLFKLLLKNLGREYITARVNGAEFQTFMTPEQMCELIALKLALGIRHQATDIEEIAEAESHLRRLNRWLERRCNRPERNGDLHPSEVALQPKDRVNAPEEWDNGYYFVTDVRGRNGVKSFIGCLSQSETWVESVEKKVLVSSIRKPIFKKSFTVVKDVRRQWNVVKKEKTIWHLERIEKIVTRRVPTTVLVGYGPLVEVYETVKEDVVRSNTRQIRNKPQVQKNWDMYVSVKSPNLFSDRRLAPDVNGVFPKTYEGPEFMTLAKNAAGEVIPTSAGQCAMHFNKCGRTHITKVMISEDHWSPKVMVKNSWCNECHELIIDDECPCGIDHVNERDMYTTQVTCLASKKSMGLANQPDRWGKLKEKLIFDDGVMMGLIVPEFRRYAERCVWTGTYMAPPILEESFKRGELRGKHLRRKEEVEKLAVLLEKNNDPRAFECYEELDALEKLRKSFNMRTNTLHVFIPMNPSLFRTKALPNGYEHLAIRVQVSGFRPHLLKIVKDNGGRHLLTSYTEDVTTKQWLKESQVWK